MATLWLETTLSKNTLLVSRNEWEDLGFFHSQAMFVLWGFFVYWSVVLRPIREYLAQMKTLLTKKGCVRLLKKPTNRIKGKIFSHSTPITMAIRWVKDSRVGRETMDLFQSYASFLQVFLCKSKLIWI